MLLFTRNFKKNQAVELPPSYLNGQDVGVMKGMKYGFFTVGDVGCGALALYNAMIYKGLEPSLPKIIRYLERTSAPFGAKFGTFPYAMGIALRRFGIKNKMTFSFKKLSEADACLIAYWVKRPIFSGGHFVFSVKQEDGTYMVYNRWSNVSEPRNCKTLREVVKKHCLMVGYILK